VWLSVIEMLKAKDNMPAVAFVFSKRKIEEITEHLNSVNLIEKAADRSSIHTFFEKSISILKGPDKKLPQVSLDSAKYVSGWMTARFLLFSLSVK
jgi:antiviral helicase SKI2